MKHLRPFEAADLKAYLQYRIVAVRPRFPKPLLTKNQLWQVVQGMEALYPNRLDRIACLRYLTSENVDSTKDISEGAAYMLIQWIHVDPDACRIEAERVLRAALLEQGQMEMRI